MKRLKQLGLVIGIVTGLTVLLIAMSSSPLAAAAGPGFDLWADRDTLPPDFEFLPIFTDDEEPGFVDLGFIVRHAGKRWEALQFTRDKQLSVTVPVGKYLFGLLGDEWPPNTVDVVDELHAGRLTTMVIDGHVIPINPSRILDLSSEEGAAAIYNAFPRFLTTGTHTLQYVWEQKRDFYFVIPFDVLGFPDPLGLNGRRFFVQGELDGDTLDGAMVLSYEVNVVP